MARELQIRSAVHLMFLRAQALLRVRLVEAPWACIQCIECIVSVYRVSVTCQCIGSVSGQCIESVYTYRAIVLRRGYEK